MINEFIFKLYIYILTLNYLTVNIITYTKESFYNYIINSINAVKMIYM